MRFTFRLFMAATFFTIAAGFASAQEASAPPPPPVPDVAVPGGELPPVPVVEPVPDPNAPPVESALTVDPSALPVAPAAVEPAPVEPAAVAPAPVAIVEPPAPEKAVVTTTTKRVTTKSTKKPVEVPAVEVKEPVDPAAAAAAAGTAAVDTTANMPPPPDAAASTVPAETVAPAAASVSSDVVETPAEGTESQTTMGIGGWLLAGLVVAVMFGLITLWRRRKTQKIVHFPGLAPELKAAPVTRP